MSARDQRGGETLGSETLAGETRGRYEVVEGAVVMPVPFREPRRGGVFRDGEIVPASLLSRGDPARLVVEAAEPAAPVATSAENAVFAGYLFGHFGHFLLESLSRLWAVRDFPNAPIVWGGPTWAYKPWQEEVLELLGVVNPPHFLEQPTGFASLVVPEPGYVMPRVFSPWHAEFLSAVEPSPLVEGRRCWLSRSGLPGDRHRVRDEAAFELALARAGWEIFRPEQHPVSAQLELMSSSSTIAGFGGSAFHSLMLLTGLESSVRIFMPRKTNVNFDTIAEQKGFDQVVTRVRARRERNDGRPSTYDFVLPGFDAVAEALEL